MKRDLCQTAASLGLLLACSGPGNTGRSGPSADLIAAVPWTNGAVPLRDADGRLVIPDEPVFPPIGLNRPDPGSRPVDCSGLSEIELSTWVETFEPEPEPETPSPLGVADGWSSYDDGTKGAFRVPGDVSWYPGSFVGPAPRYTEEWGLAADRITNGPSCDGQPNNWAFHFRGGRFNYFGAGAEHPLARRSANPARNERCPLDSDLCPAEPADGALTDPVGLPRQRPDGTPFKQVPHRYWDLSLYDGVIFWARRGPDGQPGVLFAIQDKHTSDALNREHQTFCRRIKDCRVECQNGSSCAIENPNAPEPVYRCFDPAVGPPPEQAVGSPRKIEPALFEELYPICGPSACVSPSYYRDADLEGTECKIYEFSGSQAGQYCYGDEPPPPDEERCGDGWVAPVRLSTDWQLYVIPFSEFRQVGFGKRAPFLDLHSIYMMALQFTVGFADVYVDNVSFYRRRR